MLLIDLLQEAVSFRRLSDKPKRNSTPDFELDTLAGDPSETNTRDPFEDPELGVDGDREKDPFAEPDDEDPTGLDSAGDMSDDQAVANASSFSSFLGGSGLGSASVSTPRAGDPSTNGADPEQEDGAVDGEQEDPAIDQLANKSTEDPNKQGLLRTVKGARLVYKRETEDGSFEELWMYNVTGDNFHDEMKRRHEILSGTDIPPNKTTSPEGDQSYETWTTSNAELLLIKGLPN